MLLPLADTFWGLARARTGLTAKSPCEAARSLAGARRDAPSGGRRLRIGPAARCGVTRLGQRGSRHRPRYRRQGRRAEGILQASPGRSIARQRREGRARAFLGYARQPVAARRVGSKWAIRGSSLNPRSTKGGRPSLISPLLRRIAALVLRAEPLSPLDEVDHIVWGSPTRSASAIELGASQTTRRATPGWDRPCPCRLTSKQPFPSSVRIPFATILRGTSPRPAANSC